MCAPWGKPPKSKFRIDSDELTDRHHKPFNGKMDIRAKQLLAASGGRPRRDPRSSQDRVFFFMGVNIKPYVG